MFRETYETYANLISVHCPLLCRWLRDNLGIIQDSSDVSVLAAQVDKTDGVYFVPAFSGAYTYSA